MGSIFVLNRVLKTNIVPKDHFLLFYIVLSLLINRTVYVRVTAQTPLLINWVFFRLHCELLLNNFKLRLLGRGFYTLTKNVSFFSPTNVGSHSTRMQLEKCRSKWDNMLVAATTLAERPTRGAMVVHLVRKVRQLFSLLFF